MPRKQPLAVCDGCEGRFLRKLITAVARKRYCPDCLAARQTPETSEDQ